MFTTKNLISRRAVLRGIGAATLALPFLDSSFGQGSTPELWFWLSAYPESPSDVSALEALIDQAFSYGYTGVAFWSSAFAFMGSAVFPANNVAYMQQLISHARSKGMQTMGAGLSPYGYSDDALINNPNWAEGEHVTGSQFTVNPSKTALVPVNSFGGLVNPGFESGLTGWFSFNDPDMGIDTTVAHSGTTSGYVTNASGNSRFQQTLSLTPWRQYHASIWIKTSNFQGFSQIEVWDPATGISSFDAQIGQQSTQDWTELDFTFNSRGSTQPSLLFGVWGGSTGTIWFDDVFLEETSLVYVLRRSGTPLTVLHNSANPSMRVPGRDGFQSDRGSSAGIRRTLSIQRLLSHARRRNPASNHIHAAGTDRGNRLLRGATGLGRWRRRHVPHRARRADLAPAKRTGRRRQHAGRDELPALLRRDAAHEFLCFL